MNRNNFILAMLLAGMLIGCLEGKTVEKFSEIEKEFYKSYRSASIEGAEKELNNFIQATLEYKKEGVPGIKYDFVLGALYVRLFLIAEKKDEYKKADEYKNKFLDLFLAGKKMTETEIKREQQKIVEFYKGMDEKNSVKWLMDVE